MNISEFAKYCGVSAATVSRYFSGKAAMSPEIRAAIAKAVQETGYQPSDKYQRRKAGRSGPILTIIPYLHHRFQADILAELQTYCDVLERQMVIICYRDGTSLDSCLEQIRAIRPSGIVLLHEGGDAVFYKPLADMHIPIVVCSGLSITRRVSAVHIDDLSAAYDGTNYLLQLGHKRIGIISDRAQAIGSGSQRIMGCQKAMADAGLPLPQEYISHAWYSFEDGYRGMMRLLERQLSLTAVFVFSDEMAAGAIAALQDQGLDVPGDISILGFDNSSQAHEIRPALTTVGQPLVQVARRSIDKLLEEGAATAVESIVLTHQIVERDSCRQL